MQVQVIGVERETPTVLAIRLRGLDEQPLPPFDAGSHIDVYLPNGVVRQYSLCGDPTDLSAYTVAIKREELSRGGSEFVHRSLRVGDVLSIGYPRNLFGLDANATNHVLLAGGIGVTPLICMAYTLSRAEKAFSLAYFVRSEEEIVFRTLFERGSLGQGVNLEVGLSAEATAERIRAVVSSAAADTHVYVCGPKGFLDTAVSISEEFLHEKQIHFEVFAPLATPDRREPSRPFVVRLGRDGRQFTVPENKSIIDVLSHAGVQIEAVCREGVCGTCIVRVIDGVPDHRDTVLSDEEKASCKRMCACVSRSKSATITIDF
ncbi:vanillate O-demethylase ferredoxin subunit [Burkholderia sp. GAS332]|nr:vanillate O-demethylase ferredoxin subunit [Burkholderia sp. GAS332]